MKKWLVLICAVMMLISCVGAAAESWYSSRDSVWMYAKLKDGTVKITRYMDDEGNVRKTLVIPSTIDGYSVSEIGDNVFIDGKWTNIVISDGITKLGSFSFHCCESLKSITIPNGVTVIADSAFNRCYELANVNIPESVVTIGNDAFFCCYALSSITLPQGLTTIGERTFVETSLSTIDIPHGVTSIEFRAFYNCSALSELIIPSTVTSIGAEAFADCSSLKEIIIPSSVTNIDYWAFRDCPNLTLTVTPGSYAEQYAIDNNIPYVYAAEATPAPDAEEGESAPADAFWTCTCGSLNDYNFCPNCGAARPVVEPTCSNCGYDPEGETPNFCPACGTRF